MVNPTATEKFINWITGQPIALFDATGSIFNPAGANATIGLVPKPGASANTPPFVLGDDAAFHSIGSLVPSAGLGTVSNLRINASVASSALTIAIKTNDTNSDPSATDTISVAFRDTTLTAGDYVNATISSALSIVAPSGQALGFIASTAARLWVLAILNGTTVELAVVNCSLGNGQAFPLNEQVLISTTAIATAPSAGVIYSTTARTGVPFRILGYIEYITGLGTPGTWSAGPDIIQLFGVGIKKPGDIVQIVRVDTGAETTGATGIPFDNTIPQNTEGNQYMTLNITPTSGANALLVDSQGNFGNSNVAFEVMTLFRDSGANALVASSCPVASAGWNLMLTLSYATLAKSTSMTTFNVRAGPSAANAGTTTFNGQGGAPLMGGVYNSYLRIMEIML